MFTINCLICGPTSRYHYKEAYIVEDVYRRAILSYGAFDATYVDYPDVLTIPKFCVVA